MRQAKRYTTAYKKKVDVERDMYLEKRRPKGIRRCAGCGAVYYRHHWALAAPPQTEKRAELRPRRAVLCPACRKIRDGYPGGELRIATPPAREKGDILRIVRNEEKRAREKNPLERIMSIETDGPTGWKIHTTTEKLAQRLGRRLRKALGGAVDYRWSHNNKFVRVVWREAVKKRQEGRMRT
ncbi:MAG TPA: BCAM0308 family protein [Candidatus Acidoferrales bacterium]|nr:BCAM0308 family protein [Candidatus Acidoferrales bacterium]